MKSQLDLENLLMYQLDWLDQKEKEQIKETLSSQPEVQQLLSSMGNFVRQIERERISYQARKTAKNEEQLELRLSRIAQWVTGDLPTDANVELIEHDIETDPHCQEFYTKLHNVFKKPSNDSLISNWQEDIRQYWHEHLAPSLHKAQNSPLPLHPAFRFRSQQPNKPIRLPIPSQYGFQLKLFVGGFNQGFHQVWGRIESSGIESVQQEESLTGANVWLLSANDSKWYQAEVKKDGKFELENVSTGIYTFEMAWPGSFLEILDVTIPSI